MSKEVGLREAWQLLMRAQSLVLVSHVGPDGDTLGSTLGLARALKLAGKRVRLLVDDILPAVYQFLPGLEAYEQPKPGEKIDCDLTVVVDASSKDRMGGGREMPIRAHPEHRPPCVQHPVCGLFAAG